MSQSDYNIENADGATVRADINSQLEAIGSTNSGSTAPSVTFPYMRWHDTANSQLKERNGANTAWIVVADIVSGELVPHAGGAQVPQISGGANANFTAMPQISGDDFVWATKAIGEAFGIRDDFTGTPIPPTDNPNFRYIKLTAGENGVGEYNEGVLISESVSGSAPLVVATAVIDLAGSPINGETVNLWNTENRYPRPGTSPGSVANDQMQNVTGTLARIGSNRVVFQTPAGGPFSADSGNDAAVDAGTGSNTGLSGRVDFDLSLAARTGTSTDVKHQQLTYYMRIS